MNSDNLSTDNKIDEDHDAVSRQIVDYYKNYAQTSDLSKYFTGSSTTYMPEIVSDDDDDNAKTLKPTSEVEIRVSGTEDDEEKPISPSSSTISTRKLEWDNGADIGYVNCSKNANILHKSLSLPAVFTEPAKNEQKEIQTESHNLIYNIAAYSSSSDNLTKDNPVESSSSSESLPAEKPQISSSSSSTGHVQAPSTTSSSLATTLAYIHQKIGKPEAESTPKAFGDGPSQVVGYTETPQMAKKKSEPKKRIFELCRTKAILIECLDQRKKGIDQIVQTTFRTEQQNEAIQTSNSLLANVDEQKNRINQSVILIDDSEDNERKSENVPTSSDAISLRSEGFEYIPSDQIERKTQPRAESSSATASSVSDLSSIPILAQLISQNQSKHLTDDVNKSIEILQKLMKSKKYDEATKKRYIKKIVQKIVNTKYSDDSTTSSELFLPKRDQKLSENLPWVPPNLSKFTVKTTTDEFLPEKQSPKKKTIFTMNQPVNNSSTNTASSTSNEKSSSLRSWKDEKTLSERIQDVQMHRGDGDQLVKFAMKERQHQIEWINDEIVHLTKLKGLLEQKQNAISAQHKTTHVYMLQTQGQKNPSNPSGSSSRKGPPGRNYIIETELSPSGSSSESIEFRYRDKNLEKNYNVREIVNGKVGEPIYKKVFGDIDVIQNDEYTTNIRVRARKPSLVGQGKYDTYPKSQREEVDRCFPCGMPIRKPRDGSRTYTIDIPLSQLRSTISGLNELTTQKLHQCASTVQCELNCPCKLKAKTTKCEQTCEFYQAKQPSREGVIQCELPCLCKAHITAAEKNIETIKSAPINQQSQAEVSRRTSVTQYDQGMLGLSDRQVQHEVDNRNKMTGTIPKRTGHVRVQSDILVQKKMESVGVYCECKQSEVKSEADKCSMGIQCLNECKCKTVQADVDKKDSKQQFSGKQVDLVRKKIQVGKDLGDVCNRKTQCKICDEEECKKTAGPCQSCRSDSAESRKMKNIAEDSRRRGQEEIATDSSSAAAELEQYMRGFRGDVDKSLGAVRKVTGAEDDFRLQKRYEDSKDAGFSRKQQDLSKKQREVIRNDEDMQRYGDDFRQRRQELSLGDGNIKERGKYATDDIRRQRTYDRDSVADKQYATEKNRRDFDSRPTFISDKKTEDDRISERLKQPSFDFFAERKQGQDSRSISKRSSVDSDKRQRQVDSDKEKEDREDRKQQKKDSPTDEKQVVGQKQGTYQRTPSSLSHFSTQPQEVMESDRRSTYDQPSTSRTIPGTSRQRESFTSSTSSYPTPSEQWRNSVDDEATDLRRFSKDHYVDDSSLAGEKLLKEQQRDDRSEISEGQTRVTRERSASLPENEYKKRTKSDYLRTLEQQSSYDGSRRSSYFQPIPEEEELSRQKDLSRKSANKSNQFYSGLVGKTSSKATSSRTKQKKDSRSPCICTDVYYIAPTNCPCRGKEEYRTEFCICPEGKKMVIGSQERLEEEQKKAKQKKKKRDQSSDSFKSSTSGSAKEDKTKGREKQHDKSTTVPTKSDSELHKATQEASTSSKDGKKDSESQKSQESTMSQTSSEKKRKRKDTASSAGKSKPSSVLPASSSSTSVSSPSTESSDEDSTSSDLSEDLSTLSSACQCCKRKRLPQKALCHLRDTFSNQIIPLCRPCYHSYQNSPREQAQSIYSNPHHVCNCYSLIDKNTIHEIKRTINELNNMNDQCYCSCSHNGRRNDGNSRYCKYCSCPIRSKAKKQKSIAYMLTFEETKMNNMKDGEDKKRKKKRKPLEEIKIKIPVPYKKKEKDRANKKKKAKRHKHDDSRNEETYTYTLQEYLVKNRPHFVQVAEGRRKSLRDSRSSREEDSEKRKMKFLLTYQDEKGGMKHKKDRLFTAREMREINKKNYKKLPEVQQKLIDNKEKQLRQANRLIADTFNKKLRDNVLKGKLTISADVNVVNL